MVATRVAADRLRVRFDTLPPPGAAAPLAFESTDDIEALDTGTASMRLQPRARAALEVAMSTRADGFHVYASGTPHLGKVDAVSATLAAAAASRAPADDWIYVFNEAQPDRPLPVRLPSGEAPRFAKAVDELIAGVQRELPRVARSGRYRKHHADLVESARAHESKILSELRPHIRPLGFDVRHLHGSLEAVPLVKGHAVTSAKQKLKKSQRKAIGEMLPRVSELVEETNRRLIALGTDFEEKHLAITRAAATEVVNRLLAPIESRFSKSKEALAHLGRLRNALVENHDLFLGEEPKPDGPPPGKPAPAQREDPFQRFTVNVLVTHDEQRGAPVLKEIHPSFSNLFGSITREMAFGVLTTDFTRLRAGVLHRANGGYLVLSARTVLAQPGAWDALKKCLRTRQIRLEELDDQLGVSTAQVLRPEPIPLECTVVLVGELDVFEALYGDDPDFRELFGVRADFDDSAVVDGATVMDAVRMVAALTRREKLLPLDRAAVARTLEAALVLAEDQQRLSLEWDRLRLLLVEAGQEARRDAATRVRAEHVARAEAAASWRAGLHEERLRQQLRRGVLRVQTSGSVVGQVNAMALMTLGDSVFGRPTRVTARVGPGRGGVIDIEREAKLGGPVHSKAVLMLQGFLLGRYAQHQPLALSAMLTFEQSYGVVEGDSASVAELVALLSALAGAPVTQSLAITCALGQDGTAQAVGGVTRKVEAFYDACRVLGLDGSQGVIVAASNVQHFMLRDDVCDAVREGQFHVHAVEHVDDALTLAMGLEPAELSKRVIERLSAFAEAVRRGDREPQ